MEMGNQLRGKDREKVKRMRDKGSEGETKKNPREERGKSQREK